MSRKRPLERLPFLSPAFPGQAAPLLVTPPGPADKAAADKAADDKQYYSSSALTTPDTKKGPLPQDWPSAANDQRGESWLGFGLAPQAWLAAASPQTRTNPHARATARLELMRSAPPLSPNPYPAVRGGPCPGDDLRDEVSQFVVQICDEFSLAQWTCYLAISYVDHTLSALHAQGLTEAQVAKHARDQVLLTVCVRLAAKFADTKLPEPKEMISQRDLRCEQSSTATPSWSAAACDQAAVLGLGSRPSARGAPLAAPGGERERTEGSSRVAQSHTDSGARGSRLERSTAPRRLRLVDRPQARALGVEAAGLEHAHRHAVRAAQPLVSHPRPRGRRGAGRAKHRGVCRHLRCGVRDAASWSSVPSRALVGALLARSTA